MTSNKSTIDIIISTVLKKTGIDAARTQIKHLATTIGKNLQNIKAGFEMVGVSIRTFVSALSKGLEFERTTVQFKSLIGSMEMAKSHMKDLQNLGRTPPFSLEEFAAASSAMMKMTGGMAGFKKEMEIVGDMAAATGNDIATVGRAFGLAYQVIRDGQDFGRAGQQLYSLGLMTKKQVAEFAELSKAGTDNAAVWAKLQEVFSRYRGAMKDTEATTQGLIDAIKGEATVAITDFSTELMGVANGGLKGLLDRMREINEDGTIVEWAQSTAESLSRVGEVASGIGTVFGTIWKSAKTAIGVPLSFIAGVAQGVGNGQGFGAPSNGWQVTKGTVADIWGASSEEEQQARASNRAAQKRARQRAKEKREKDLAAEAEKRQAEDLARAQEETSRRIAEEKAKAEAEATRKAIEAEQKAREKMEADLHKQRLDNINAEMKAAQDAERGQQNALNAAQTEFDRAFAMYRSDDKGAAQIAEERDYAKDYKQLQKDASRYGGKWRIDELSALIAAGDTRGQAAKLEEWRKSSSFTPEVESMVRAAAADQTRTTAEDELRKISANTEGLAKKLDELLQVK